MKVHLLTIGDVADAVAHRLTEALRAAGDLTSIDRIVGGRGLHPSYWPHADLRVVIAWRESAAEFEVVDRSCAETGVPFTQAVFTHPRLRVGPTIVPGGGGEPSNTVGGCQRCLERRQRQHDAGIERAEALWQRYAVDDTAGPSGYLPHHVSLATALLARVVAAARAGRLEQERNVVRSVHLLRGTTHLTELIPVHGCERCGVQRLDSTWARLASEFADLGAIAARRTAGV
ncbi:hypothetical protein [Rathayibacter toxicus]|uniref:TOMM leader peptide-binding protein n=1 Tax=Rathayibacter toxicus TaxID=145458 RepID=A0A0C5BFX6_9MICO|nr:hypothetical protein [Rathayibacter toxicus]AJM77085.1 hypothetical protein TI83_02160 [Rathayibacter toxicus]ALS57087.1 hypothetical protein APU90_04315 [Rathayibacter toxicus]KKM46089.1 hypothetical protein VT73_03170 [Rathayibacter toxicus]QOD08104.1 hypothetical protein AYW78_09665 [Rathayibacter toxicus]QOD10201.1 hypothetical protein BSG36_09840 [Rathayibacter toxicus]